MLDNTRRVRLIGAAVIATLLVGTTVGAEAATKKKVVKHTRTVTLTYRGGCTVDTPAVLGNESDACHAFGGADWELRTRTGEKYVSVKVADATGRSVPGQFWIHGSSVGHDTAIPFCGSMKDFRTPISTVQIDLDAVGAVTSCPGLATSGKVTVVFSNLP
jgi:hypothetical protein